MVFLPLMVYELHSFSPRQDILFPGKHYRPALDDVAAMGSPTGAMQCKFMFVRLPVTVRPSDGITVTRRSAGNLVTVISWFGPEASMSPRWLPCRLSGQKPCPAWFSDEPCSSSCPRNVKSLPLGLAWKPLAAEDPVRLITRSKTTAGMYPA